jgi:hypothetical protein
MNKGINNSQAAVMALLEARDYAHHAEQVAKDTLRRIKLKVKKGA